MFPNGNVGLENSKFYEDVPARGHLNWSRRHGELPRKRAVAFVASTSLCCVAPFSFPFF
jgi:hypothetical protein